jgi:hypothetical protein
MNKAFKRTVRINPESRAFTGSNTILEVSLCSPNDRKNMVWHPLSESTTKTAWEYNDKGEVV